MSFTSLIRIQFYPTLKDIGVSPRMILKMGTTYEKVVKIQLSEDKMIAGRLKPIPAHYHNSSKIFIPDTLKNLYQLEDETAIVSLVEPPFIPLLIVKKVQRNVDLNLPGLGFPQLQDKSVVFPGMIYRTKDAIFKVKSLGADSDVGIINYASKVQVVGDSNTPIEEPISLKQMYHISLKSIESGNKSSRLVRHKKPLILESTTRLKGIDNVIEQLKTEVILPFHELLNSTVKQKENIGGVLLYGPPGCGKTELAHSIAKDLNVEFFPISIGELASKWAHEFGKNLAKKFEEAASHEDGAIIFLDEFDSFAGNRKNHSQSWETEEVNVLLQQLDPKNLPPHVLVIAATNLLSNLDPAVTRSGRFDTKIAVTPPDHQGRVEILRQKIEELQVETSGITNGFLEEMGWATQGFVGADINSLVKKSYRLAKNETRNSDTILGLNSSHIEQMIASITPVSESLMGIKKPTIRKDDLPGSEQYVDDICTELQLLLKPETFRDDVTYSPDKGFLLYGPPGTGKTSIANAVANESGLLFKVIKSNELSSKWVAETQQNIRGVFENARLFQPILIFLDEIDSISGSREFGVEGDALYSLMSEIDTTESDDQVIVIAATNNREKIDPALLRPGRFTTHFAINKPDLDQIVKIIRKLLLKTPNKFTESEINELAEVIQNKELRQTHIRDLFNKVNRHLKTKTKKGDLADKSLFTKSISNYKLNESHE